MAPGCSASSVVQPRQASSAVLQGKGVRQTSADSALRARCRCGACQGPGLVSLLVSPGFEVLRSRSSLVARPVSTPGGFSASRSDDARTWTQGIVSAVRPRGEQVRPKARLFVAGPSTPIPGSTAVRFAAPCPGRVRSAMDGGSPCGTDLASGGVGQRRRSAGHSIAARPTPSGFEASAVKGRPLGTQDPLEDQTVERALGFFHVVPRRHREGNGELSWSSRPVAHHGPTTMTEGPRGQDFPEGVRGRGKDRAAVSSQGRVSSGGHRSLGGRSGGRLFGVLAIGAGWAFGSSYVGGGGSRSRTWAPRLERSCPSSSWLVHGGVGAGEPCKGMMWVSDRACGLACGSRGGRGDEGDRGKTGRDGRRTTVPWYCKPANRVALLDSIPFFLFTSPSARCRTQDRSADGSRTTAIPLDRQLPVSLLCY
ncbi:hypothetical protein V8E36_004983 [Tilletia maclaganii]